MIYTLDQCRDKGSEHAAYDWSTGPLWDEDDSRNPIPWDEEKLKAYFEGYYAHGSVGQPPLNGDALKAKVDAQYIAHMKSRHGDGWPERYRINKWRVHHDNPRKPYVEVWHTAPDRYTIEYDGVIIDTYTVNSTEPADQTKLHLSAAGNACRAASFLARNPSQLKVHLSEHGYSKPFP